MASGIASAAASVDPATIAGRVRAGAERRPHRDPAGDDHRRDGAGDPDADPDPERREQDQRHVGRDAPGGAEPGDQRDARRERQPRPEARRQPRAERREQPHAQDRDGRQQPGRRRREAEVGADQRQQRPDGEELLRSASDATNSPTTTAMGTRGAGDDTPRCYRTSWGRPSRSSVAGSATPPKNRSRTSPEHRLVRSRAMEQRHRRAQLDRVDPAEDVLRRAALGSRARSPRTRAAAARAPGGRGTRGPRRATRSRRTATSRSARARRPAGTRTTSSGRSCGRRAAPPRRPGTRPAWAATKRSRSCVMRPIVRHTRRP